MPPFCSIIPLEHSIGTEPLIYKNDLSGEIIQVGCIVEIPYGKNQEYGIVATIYKECPIDMGSESYLRIKSIEKVITNKVLLAPYQIGMICKISSRYMIPIHRVAAIFLSKPIRSRLEKKDYIQLTEIKKIPKEKERIWEIHIIQDDIITPEIVDIYIQRPTVIIVPDDYAMIPYREFYRERGDILFVSNEMTETRKAQSWIDIANGIFPIIYWTRKILYYNLSAYSDIIYIEDALGPDYWHYPIRIEYIDILSTFVWACPDKNIIILTSVPRLSTLVIFKDFQILNKITKNSNEKL